MFKTKECSFDNCKNGAWKDGICKNHLSKSSIKSKKKEIDIEAINKQRDFFMKIWRDRLHKSFVSNKPICGETLSIYFHHILPKEKYPEACFDEENIVLLLFEEHQTIENDMYFYPKINELRNKLKIKYNIK